MFRDEIQRAGAVDLNKIINSDFLEFGVLKDLNLSLS